MHLQKSSVMVGPVSDSIGIKTAGIYKLEAFMTDVPPTGTQITLSQSGSTSASFSSEISGVVQEKLAIIRSFNCAVGDILTCSVSSTISGQTALAMIKTTTIIKQVG